MPVRGIERTSKREVPGNSMSSVSVYLRSSHVVIDVPYIVSWASRPKQVKKGLQPLMDDGLVLVVVQRDANEDATHVHLSGEKRLVRGRMYQARDVK